jgi:hypothetical protein
MSQAVETDEVTELAQARSQITKLEHRVRDLETCLAAMKAAILGAETRALGCVAPVLGALVTMS